MLFSDDAKVADNMYVSVYQLSLILVNRKLSDCADSSARDVGAGAEGRRANHILLLACSGSRDMPPRTHARHVRGARTSLASLPQRDTAPNKASSPVLAGPGSAELPGMRVVRNTPLTSLVKSGDSPRKIHHRQIHHLRLPQRFSADCVWQSFD